MNNKNAAAAELALKAHSAQFNPAQFGIEQTAMNRIAQSVDLREAPEDAVCSLVIDLMHYCECKNIDWGTDIVSRTRESLRIE